MKKQLFLAILLALTGFIFSGCETLMSNLTTEQVPQNPSDIYALKFKANLQDANVLRNTVKAHIVIDGKTHPMRQTDEGFDVFEYDYHMPSDRNVAKYYYTVKYKVNVSGAIYERTMQSALHELELVNRYVVSMQSTRGLVGSKIPVVGRGLREDDQVMVGGVVAPTQYSSPNSLAFIIPALPSGVTYPVEIINGKSTLPVGEFRVDSSKLSVNVEDIEVESGERTILVFQIDNDATGEGLELNITTDVPNSILMADAVIPEGARSVSVMVEGGEPGEGSLFVEAPGYSEVIIPLNVSKES